MIITTTENIPSKEYEIIGLVSGTITQSKSMLKDFGAGFKSMVGGEVKSYTEMQENAREEAVNRMRNNASHLGADAIVMVRFESSSIVDMQSVLVYGTAVKFK